MSQVTEQSVRFQTALASIKLIQASAVLDLTEDDFDFLTSNKVWIATDRSRARRCVEACVYGTRSEERFSRNAETDLVCRLLLEKKKPIRRPVWTTISPPLLLRLSNGRGKAARWRRSLRPPICERWHSIRRTGQRQ